MGIDEEKLVFDYLSRVGDLAHGTAMSSAERARLVNRLRDEIGRQRSGGASDARSPSVKRILGRLGSPEDVVAEAAGSPPPAPARPTHTAATSRPSASPAGPAWPSSAASARPAPAPEPPTPREAEPPAGARPEVPARWPAEGRPRVAGWQQGSDEQIAGFSGGIDIPELMHPSGLAAPDEPGAATEAELTAAEAEREAAEAALARPVVEDADPPRPRRGARLAKAVLAGRRRGGIVELLGVAALAGGAVFGSFPAMLAGWALAYWSPRLSPRAGQWATFGMPALVATGYGVWLMGRAGGYWGEALADGQANELLRDDWPTLLRLAGLASAAFLLFLARRPVKEG
ncbi:hypothetical protein SAMN06297387_12464 [Streptomyces zhaozhouensis]|uniref:Uncharacterized protein n=1 Tax=Streptomyces zhaozhouensis TaxID=1300267 RepID=A0A286E5C4_9ACTN|nr:hypothetical protein [Streptomyces zhaozhouensis]SOD66093.1 hypothetical protein SAMN06297387_12464 [Streptomyces zhaozhouensis]